jgi:hypothetical protein
VLIKKGHEKETWSVHIDQQVDWHNKASRSFAISKCLWSMLFSTESLMGPQKSHGLIPSSSLSDCLASLSNVLPPYFALVHMIVGSANHAALGDVWHILHRIGYECRIRQRRKLWALLFPPSIRLPCITSVYIYIYVHVYIYIYIYIYSGRCFPTS